MAESPVIAVVESTHHRVYGPFTHNVYLGFTVLDMPRMLKVQKCLEQNSIVCYPRLDALRPDKLIKSTIYDGISRSHKCLVLLSNEYVDDDHFTIESQKVVEKAKRFSSDTVILLKDESLSKVPECFAGLHCQILSFTEADSDNPTYMNELVKTVLQEPNPMLSLIPKENIGYGSALGYFYGFLRLILPDFRERLENNVIAEYDDPELGKRTVRKLLIIMPESCFCPPEFTDPGRIEHTNKYIVRVAHRAGNKNRDYKSSLYKIMDTKNNTEYYFVGELATPLLTMYESYYYGLVNMSRDELNIERDAFYISLKAVLDHPNNHHCNRQYKLLFWPSDPGMAGTTKSLSLYDFLLPVIRTELANEATKDPGGNLESDSAVAHLENTTASEKPTFTTVITHGSNPAAIYEDTLFSYYKMDSQPRGICLIINIANFDKGPVPLAPRRGANVDGAQLKELFGAKLRFKVEEHNDLTLATLEKLLVTTSMVDHSDYNAFVCCFLTHGRLGKLFTADGQQVRVVDVADYFTDKNCKTLCGKPKMFFIQACLKGEENPETSPNNGQGQPPAAAASTAMQHDDTSDYGYESNVESDSSASLDWDANIVPTLVAADQQERSWMENKATLVPGAPDFLMSYATLPGAVAYRDTEIGSLYIGELAHCLAMHMEIDRALKLVSGGVKKRLKQLNEQDQISRFQLPFHLTTGMSKLLRL